MNQLNMWRKTVFGSFIRIGSYVWRIAFGRFARKLSERAAFIVTMSALVFRSRACVAFSVSRLLSELQVEKSGTASTSFGNSKKVEGYLENCQETSRRDPANKHSLELCASIVLYSSVVVACDVSVMYS